MRLRKCVPLLLILVIVSATASVLAAERGKTYYIDPEGSDGASGSAEKPWRTLKHAVGRVEPGDTVIVRPGKHRGTQVDDLHGTKDAPIVIRGTDRKKCVIDGTLGRENEYQGGRDAIFLNECSHIVIEKLSLVDAQRAGVLVVKSPHVTVRDCIVRDNGKWGLFTNHSPHVTFEGCDISGSKKEHGIYFANGGSDHCTARGNVIHHNSQCGIHNNGDPDAGGDGIASDLLIEKNIIHHNGERGGSAINMTFVQDSIVRNNLCYANFAGGIVLYRDTRKAPDKYSNRVAILNNTVYFKRFQGRWACAVQDQSHHVVLLNNIFYGGRYGAFAVGPDCRKGLFSDNNLIYNHPMQRMVGCLDRNWLYSIRDWRRAGYGLSSDIEDPRFVNPRKGDFHLKEESVGRKMGLPLDAVPDDLTGTPRPKGKTTVGCYQE